MAITTLDGVIAGMQYPREFVKALTGAMVVGRPHSLFYLGGIPGAATEYNVGLTGTSLITFPGQIPFNNPVSGNTYLARFQGMCTQAGTLMLCDRLWHNNAIPITGGTGTVNSVPWPPRDADGSTNGNGVYIGYELGVTGTAAGTPTITVGYTNSSGTAGRIGTNIVATTATSLSGEFFPIGLMAGDNGVRSVQYFNLSATWTSGIGHLVAYRILARLELTGANVPNAIDALTGGFPRLFNNTVPFLLFIPNATMTSNITGHIIYSQG